MPVSLALLLSETLLDFCRRVARSGTVIMKLTVKDWTQGERSLGIVDVTRPWRESMRASKPLPPESSPSQSSVGV